MADKTVKTVKIYQLKVTIKGTKPAIWRRILIPKNMNFSDLHGAIQDAMGWSDSHLHRFTIKRDCIGIANYKDEPNTISGKIVKIGVYFESIGDKALYEYDFGDDWEHEVVLEKIIEEADGSKYPQCVDGKLACPPENCGGVVGYRELLIKLANPKHKEHKEAKKWMEELYPGFKANVFNPKQVEFTHFKTKAVQEPYYLGGLFLVGKKDYF